MLVKAARGMRMMAEGGSSRAAKAMSELFKNILCPIDFDDNSIAGLDEACTLAQQRDGVVHLLHVVHIVPTSEFPIPVETYVEMEKDAKNQLEELARTHLEGKVRYDVRTKIGEPAYEILDEIPRLNADSVVMATHGRTGVKRFFLGSVAERVVRESSRPVLTIRSAAA